MRPVLRKASNVSSPATCSPPLALPERELFARSRAGDAGAREQLVVRFLPAAGLLARRYQRSGEAIDDLYQVAAIGLLKAIDRFDVERGIAFWTYATPTILGELKRHFRDYTWAVRVPRSLCDLAVSVHRQSSRLSEALGRDPTIAELACAVGVGETEIVEALRARAGYSALSLDAPGAGAPRDPAEAVTLADSLGFDEHGFEHAEHRALLEPLLPGLSPRDREVLRMRFVQDLTQSEIALAIGVSQVHISRIIHQALGRLRAAAGNIAPYAPQPAQAA